MSKTIIIAGYGPGTSTDAKIQSNQALKEKVGAEYNAAVTAYKAKHPGG